ncbi:MAG: virulence RhuM family protein, partial [Kiritimatiellae bacterium]|nr:virulence RhuM family protein [Kiritimatiellia bacterium]
MNKNEIILFEAMDGKVSLPVQVNAETVWLTLRQMAELFDKDKTVIFRHVKNAISEGEVDPRVTIAKFAQVTPHGAIPGRTRTQVVDFYNLDVIISVGYRVHSQRGVEFRRWSTKVLKEYLVRGYAVNRDRIRKLGMAVNVMKRVSNSLDVDQVLDVV